MSNKPIPNIIIEKKSIHQTVPMLGSGVKVNPKSPNGELMSKKKYGNGSPRPKSNLNTLRAMASE